VPLLVTPRIRLPEGNYLVKGADWGVPGEAREEGDASAVVHVIEKAPPGRRAPPTHMGALVADAHHQHVCTDRMEAVPLLEVPFQLSHQPVLDVHDALADLADSVLVVLDSNLVVDRTITEPNRVQGTGRGERLQGAIDRAARKARLLVLQIGGDLVGCAVAAQPLDSVPHLLALPRLAHAGPERRGNLRHVRRLP